MYDLYKILNRGIFAVNKIKYFTSAEVVEQLKETIRRVVGVGEGCQLLARFLHGNKKYVVTGCLGSETTTYNETGIHVNSAPYDHISKESLEEALMSFRGKILQTPPKYSALKMGGRRIADLTRSGINVEMKPRHVMCYNVKCTDFNPPFFKLALSCGPGFYVRSLVHDLGLVTNWPAETTSNLHRADASKLCHGGPHLGAALGQGVRGLLASVLWLTLSSGLREAAIHKVHRGRAWM
ncbi:probable tRNA pseudouridine synthase 1 isoform X3 [Schistocerca piceifrons]|uniref:probable tRNA pseudouridine synthase 1 isoform X3 n=1 Tax=Schistocerca piceifrons TaxID=274613 RepID=UPI001F5F0C5E|nr:probable tRNA pseudouridine synthase 1 isoform X3 [Schistocerca piceifrons]